MSTTVDRIVEKWERTGLLEALAEEKIAPTAILLEHLCVEMISKSPSPLVTNTLFPVARRLMGEGHTVNAKWLIQDYQKFVNEQVGQSKHGLVFCNIDYEVELVENYIKAYPSRTTT